MKKSLFLTIAFVATQGVLTSVSYAETSKPPDGQADLASRVGSLFEKAQAAYDRGDKEGAYEAYREAWTLQRSYDIAGNLGGIELKLGKTRDAAEHFAYALEHFPPTGLPEQREALRKKLTEAESKVGRLRIAVNVAGASVRVNGTEVGTSPISREIYVEPGACTVAASLDGYQEVSMPLQATKGGKHESKLVLVAEPAGPSTAVVVTGGALTLAALGLGFGMMAAANSRSDSASVALEGIRGTGYSCKSPVVAVPCEDLRNILKDQSTYHDVSVGAFVGASAILVATVGYVLVPQLMKEPSVGGLRLVPHTGSGVALTGSF